MRIYRYRRFSLVRLRHTLSGVLYYHILCKCAVRRFWRFCVNLYPFGVKRLIGAFLPVSCDSVTLYNFSLLSLYTLYHIILSMSSIDNLSGRYSPTNISPSTYQPTRTCQLVKVLTNSFPTEHLHQLPTPTQTPTVPIV